MEDVRAVGIDINGTPVAENSIQIGTGPADNGRRQLADNLAARAIDRVKRPLTLVVDARSSAHQSLEETQGVRCLLCDLAETSQQSTVVDDRSADKKAAVGRRRC
jgi:hypothetical protein